MSDDRPLKDRIAALGLRLVDKLPLQAIAAIPVLACAGVPPRSSQADAEPVLATSAGNFGSQYLARQCADLLETQYKAAARPFDYMAEFVPEDIADEALLDEALAVLRARGWAVEKAGRSLTLMPPDCVGFF